MDFDSTVQAISWFRDRYREGTLVIRPPYQRKPVWAARQKCYLIESILLRLPVPELFIQQVTTPDGDTTYAVVDGQQRIRTVLQFVGAETEQGEEQFNKFVLDKLEPQSPWRNLTFAELDDDTRRLFYGYKFAVRYLETSSEAEVREMFRRLNKFQAPLKPQELRNATYTGPFARLASTLADSDYWAENRIVPARSIRNMGDVEFIAELLIGVQHGPQGGSPRVIDDYYSLYEDYDDEFPGQRDMRRLFMTTLRFVQDLLPGIGETRWSNKTDFYSLFVAIAHELRLKTYKEASLAPLREELTRFEDQITAQLAQDEPAVRREVATYIRAVQRGANDKARRAERHSSLLSVISPFFIERR
jgi:hypothetical protein